jgi:hypothetical protein
MMFSKDRKKIIQQFKDYRNDTIDYFLPGIDITYLTYGNHNPPLYSHKCTFKDNILTITISYFDSD